MQFVIRRSSGFYNQHPLLRERRIEVNIAGSLTQIDQINPELQNDKNPNSQKLYEDWMKCHKNIKEVKGDSGKMVYRGEIPTHYDVCSISIRTPKDLVDLIEKSGYSLRIGKSNFKEIPYEIVIEDGYD